MGTAAASELCCLDRSMPRKVVRMPEPLISGGALNVWEALAYFGGIHFLEYCQYVGEYVLKNNSSLYSHAAYF